MKKTIKIVVKTTLVSCYIVNLLAMFVNLPIEILVANVLAWVLILGALGFIALIDWICEED